MEINDLIQQREDLKAKANEILVGAEEEADLKRFDQMQGQIERLSEQIAKEQEERDLEVEHETRDRIMQKDDDDVDWREFGEVIQAVVRGGSIRGLEVQTGEAGGFLVPKQFRDEILSIGPQDAIVRPRANVIPAGDPPDSEVTIPAIDQANSKGVYSGVTVEWIEEGGDKPETEPSFRQISLKPNEVAGHIVITNKLLKNSQAAGQYVRTVLRQAIAAAEDVAFFKGDGVGKPLGVVGHPAAVEITRDAGNVIDYENDLVDMYARFMGTPVWIASRTTLPQLMTMEYPTGNLVWQPNAREGAPGTLMGIPVLLNERSPVLGDTGDLVLADLSYYLIKDGSPLELELSEHVHFLKNQSVIKAAWNTDGQPWLTSPLEPEHGDSSHTVSPFVVLEEN